MKYLFRIILIYVTHILRYIKSQILEWSGHVNKINQEENILYEDKTVEYRTE